MEIQSWKIPIKDELRFPLLPDAFPDPILITNTSGKIFYANPAWEKLTQYSLIDVIGKTPEILKSGKTPKSVYRKMWKTLERGESFCTEEMVNKRRDGTEYSVHSTFFPVKKYGRNIYYVQTCQDITHRKFVEDKKTLFISLASHELKTPITTLKLLFQSHIKKHAKMGMPVSHSSIILHELDRLIDLVNQLLDISRIERKRLHLNLQEVHIKKVIENVLEKIHYIAENHTIKHGIIPDVVVIADEHRLEQVLMNFFTNAIKYSLPKTTISLSASVSAGHVTVSIKDEGKGIAKKSQMSIFEPFYRIDETAASGFGLGLFICKNIIHAHKGKIGVSSKVGEGSTFYFRLPIAKA